MLEGQLLMHYIRCSCLIQQLQDHSSVFGFLYDIQKCPFQQSKPSSFFITAKPCNKQGWDIDADRELCVWFLRRDPLEILHFLHRRSLIKRFPNTSANVRIVLTLPVSVVTGERSFSQLKLIKSHVTREIGGSSHVSVESCKDFLLWRTLSLVSQFAKKDQEGKVKF